MDKIVSARIDESTAYLLDTLSNKLQVSKKKILEEAIRSFAQKVQQEQRTDIFSETCGAWKRGETSDYTVKMIRKQFQDSMERHQK